MGRKHTHIHMYSKKHTVHTYAVGNPVQYVVCWTGKYKVQKKTVWSAAPVGQPNPTRPKPLTQTPLPQLTAWSQFMAGAWSKYPVGRFCVRRWFGFVSGFVSVPNLRSKHPWQWAGSGLVLCAFYPIRNQQVKTYPIRSQEIKN